MQQLYHISFRPIFEIQGDDPEIHFLCAENFRQISAACQIFALCPGQSLAKLERFSTQTRASTLCELFTLKKASSP
jgi:hypothetical protein